MDIEKPTFEALNYLYDKINQSKPSSITVLTLLKKKNVKSFNDDKIDYFGFNQTITDIPTNRRVNKKLWNRCVGCWDCAINCPVKAIHNDGNKMENNWLDSSACDDFLGLGNHPTIPSVLTLWHEKVYPELSKKQADYIGVSKVGPFKDETYRY